jgi:hypothetical protein
MADNLASADVHLTADQLEHLDTASAITLGFPNDVVAASGLSLAGGRADLIDSTNRIVR